MKSGPSPAPGKPPTARRRSKFNATPEVVDGIRFASKAEARRYTELRTLQRAGKISELELQPRFVLACGGKTVMIRSAGFPNGRVSVYHADFRYKNESGARVVEEVKGFDQPISRLRRAVVETEYGIRIDVVR